MAKITICDFSKDPIKNGDPVYILNVDGQEFEISKQSKDSLLMRLLNDEGPPPSPGVTLSPPEGTPPSSLDRSAEQFSDVADIATPDDPTKPLPMPSEAQVKKVISESTLFKTGSLPTLSIGNKSRQIASQKLQEIEEEKNPSPKQDRKFK